MKDTSIYWHCLMRHRIVLLLACAWMLASAGCWQASQAPPPAQATANIVPAQATDQDSLFDKFADIARQSQGPDIDEPDPFPPATDVDPIPPAEALADEDGIIEFFQTDEWRIIKEEAHRNLMIANRQPRVRDCMNINVVLIVIDDLGFGDLGIYGQPRIKTPNIDLLAQTGVRFDNYYAGSSVGMPSHCTLFTGRHSGHCRVRSNSENASLEKSDFTLSDMMFMAGMETAMFGSWKLGGATTPGAPINKGFEESYGYLDREHARNFYPNYLWRNDLREAIPGNQNNAREHYSLDLITDEAVEYVRRSRSRPFFVFVSLAPPRGILDHVPSLEPYSGEDWPREQKQYAAMISRVDDAVGRIMNTLYRLNMKENTVVVLTSDNGPHKDGVNPEFFDSNGPLNGVKGTLSEGGIRVPMIVWGPSDVIRAAGGVRHDVWWAPDLMPTLADLVSAWRRPRNLDGVSQLSIWHGQLQEDRPPLYWELHEGGFSQAVRNGPWKGIRTGPAEPIKLYNLEDDPGETTNLAQSQPGIVREIGEIMEQSRRDSRDWPVQ